MVILAGCTRLPGAGPRHHVPLPARRDDTATAGTPAGRRRSARGVLERAWEERERKASTGDFELTYVKAWPDSLENARGKGEQPLVGSEPDFRLREAVLPAAEAAGTEWENTITLQSAYHIARYEGQDHLPGSPCRSFGWPPTVTRSLRP